MQAAFLRPPLVGRAAYATLAFLNALGGPRFASLQACLIQSYVHTFASMPDTNIVLMQQHYRV